MKERRSQGEVFIVDSPLLDHSFDITSTDLDLEGDGSIPDDLRTRFQSGSGTMADWFVAIGIFRHDTIVKKRNIFFFINRKI